MLCSAKHLRFARANVATTTTSTSRVDVAVARKAVIRSRGRTGRVSTRASGDDGEGRGQDVQNDWDGAWRAFKRDFVGEDAKMPGDYVETKFKSKRRSPDADAKQQIYDDEDRVLNFATSNSFSVAGVIGVVVLLFLFVVVIGPPPSDGRCSLPWCG